MKNILFAATLILLGSQYSNAQTVGSHISISHQQVVLDTKLLRVGACQPSLLIRKSTNSEAFHIQNVSAKFSYARAIKTQSYLVEDQKIVQNSIRIDDKIESGFESTTPYDVDYWIKAQRVYQVAYSYLISHMEICESNRTNAIIACQATPDCVVDQDNFNAIVYLNQYLNPKKSRK